MTATWIGQALAKPLSMHHTTKFPPKPYEGCTLSILILQIGSEAQRGQVTCPNSHRQSVPEPGFDSRLVRLLEPRPPRVGTELVWFFPETRGLGMSRWCKQPCSVV